MPPLFRFLAPGALTVSCLIALSGCARSADGSVLGFLSPYRVEVVQGNVVTQEMAAQLRVGLTRDQVRGVLGSPLLADVFHADRWDYVFTIRRQGAASQQRRVTVLFEQDKVVLFEAPALPSEREFVDSIDVSRVRNRSQPLALTEDQVRALPLPEVKAVSTPAAPASGPLRNYPPLEPIAPR